MSCIVGYPAPLRKVWNRDNLITTKNKKVEPEYKNRIVYNLGQPNEQVAYDSETGYENPELLERCRQSILRSGYLSLVPIDPENTGEDVPPAAAVKEV